MNLSFQSTLSRRERLKSLSSKGLLFAISIHALTKRATAQKVLVLLSPLLFQSTLSRRERRQTLLILVNKLFYFNPRSHEESDLSRVVSVSAVGLFQSTLSRRERLGQSMVEQPQFDISIHALTKRATGSEDKQRQLFFNFNPRSHEESDATYPVNISLMKIFQSTLSRRERHIVLVSLIMIPAFQSTLSRRERPTCFTMTILLLTFQSTLSRRERPQYIVYCG